jgi:ligand-binding sensor domain-containing protein/two-component sensor histidine kinase
VKGNSFFLFFLILIVTYRAQNPTFNFQKLGNEEGLTNNNVLHITQHANGLMYFTSQNGIYYYGGDRFTKLVIDSLKTNSLHSIAFKNDNELYLSVNGEGIALYNLKTKKYTMVPELKIKGNNAEQFMMDNDYAYFLSRQIKFSVRDLKTGEDVVEESERKLKENRPYCMLRTQDKKILLGRSDGLYEVKGNRQVRMEALKNIQVNSIAEAPDGRIIAGCNNKIVFIKDGKIEKEFTPHIKTATFNLGGDKSIDNIIADSFGRVWFTAYPGESLYLLQNETVYDIFDLLGIQQELIQYIFKDRDENIWIGTLDDGVYYIQNTFLNSMNFSFNSKILNVNKIFMKNDLLVAATSNGLYGLNLLNNQTKTLSKPDVYKENVTSIAELDNIIYYASNSRLGMAPSIFMDSRNTYKFKPVQSAQICPMNSNELAATDIYGRDLLRYEISSGKIKDTIISFPDYKIKVTALIQFNGKLYAGTNNGLYVYDIKSGKSEKMPAREVSFRINDLAAIDGKLYAAHESGITEVASNRLIQNAGHLNLSSVKKITTVKDKICLATGEGVFICDKNFVPLKIISKSAGLSSNSVSDIVVNENRIGIATARGVATSDILSFLNFNSTLRPVSIEYIRVNGVNADSEFNTLSLKSDQDNLEIRFISPFFNNYNSKQYYRYRYNGGSWNFINDNSFSYGIPSGGKHRFDISASIDNINWSEPTTINITKEEKLSESNLIYWLITLGGLCLIAAVSFVIIRRVNAAAKKRLEEERQVNLLKHQAMNSLLSPHFIFNSLTSIQNYINSNNSLKASEYLAKFSRLIRMIIEKAAQSDITLNDELIRLNYYLELEKERFKNKFDFHIHVDEKLNRGEIKIPNMIIQPHVENCIIHGILPKMEHGTLNINFTKTQDNKLLIKIEDDGIGLIKAKEHAKTGHKSLGTSTIRTILEINSKLSGKKQTVSMVDKSTLNPPSNGTLITIELEL